MPKAPKVIQLVAAPRELDIVRGETAKAQRHGIRVVDPVVALALLEDGTIRAVYVECLRDDNVGVLKVAPADALLNPWHE